MATRPSLPGGARRVAARLPGAVKVAAIAAGAAMVAAGLLLGVLSSSPGHRLLLRLLTRAVQAEVDGQVRIRSLAGPLWRGADVRGVELATPDGRPVFRVERVRVRYGAWDLLRRRFVLSRVEIEGLVLALERGEGEGGAGDGRWNIERLFRLDRPRPPRAGPRPLIDLRHVRVEGGSVRVRSAGVTRRVQDIRLDLARARLSHPDSAPVEIGIRQLAFRARASAFEVVGASGHLLIGADSLHLSLERLRLPHSDGAAHGALWWEGPSARWDASVHLRDFDWRDFHGLGASLPSRGGGMVAARSRSLPDASVEWTISRAAFRTGRSSLEGSARLRTTRSGGVQIAALTVLARPLDLTDLAPYLDTPPPRGLVRGTLRASGTPADLAVAAVLDFTDAAVRGRPRSVLRVRGGVALGSSGPAVRGDGARGGARARPPAPPNALAFHRLELAPADLALPSVSRLIAGLPLGGRLRAAGILDGSLADLTFTGELVHSGTSRPALEAAALAPSASTVRGTARLVLGAADSIEAALLADSLSLDGLRDLYPALPLSGKVAGPVRLHGPLTALRVDLALGGPAGSVRAAGTVGTLDSVVTVGIGGRVDGLDLEPLLAGAPPTALSGEWDVDVAIPGLDAAASAAGAAGKVRLALGPSRVRGVAIRRAALAVALAADRVMVDSAVAEGPSGALALSGTFARAGGSPGELDFVLAVDDLARLGPWLETDLAGSGRISGRLRGGVASWELEAKAATPGARYGAVAVGPAWASLALRSLPGAAEPWLGGSGAAEFLRVAEGRLGPVEVRAAGPLGALKAWLAVGFGGDGTGDGAGAGGAGGGGGGGGGGGSVRAAGTVTVGSGAVRGDLDTLTLELPGRLWTLRRPARFAVEADSVGLDSLELRSSAGAGRVVVSGRYPLRGPADGEIAFAASGVPLVDLFALAERDTAGVGGSADLALVLAGALSRPRFEGSLTVADPRWGGFAARRLDGTFRYAPQRLAFTLGVSRDGRGTLSADGSVPLDLALVDVPDRRLPGQLDARVRADSVDLAVLGVLSGTLADVRGALDADVRVGGSWARPDLGGALTVTGGAATVAGLGRRYTDIELALELKGDRAYLTRARAWSGGVLDVGGDVQLVPLTRPSLNLRLAAREFDALAVRHLATLTVSGVGSLTGPWLGARLTGRATVDAGTLAFADLVLKQIVNLDDPEFLALVDSTLARAAELGPSRGSALLDSLEIDALAVALGPDVWLRSREANIQLAGNLTVSKTGAQYRLDGALAATRGTYRLPVGPTTREFEVTRGTVRYYGTPDLNPALDILAQHTVRAVRGNDVVVRARIGGTLLAPRLSLESDERPPLSESEIIAYLLFGRPASDLFSEVFGVGGGAERRVFRSAVLELAGVLSGDLGQALVQDLGVPVDYITIRPGGGGPGVIFRSARLEAGTQIGGRTFLTLNAGLCEVRHGLPSQLLGASLFYRFSGSLSLAASVEPVISDCQPGGGRGGGRVQSVSTTHQVGLDLLWRWGFR